MCDCLVALPAVTQGRVTIFAKNSDRPPDERQVMEVIEPRLDRSALRCTHIDIEPWPHTTFGTVLSRPQWRGSLQCWGAEHGVNERGVAVGNEAIYTTLDPRPAPAALTGLDLVRLALERSATAGEAVGTITRLLDTYGQGGTAHDPAGASGPKPYWSSFLVADPTAAWVIETSGRTWQSAPVVDVAAISNRTTIAEFDAVHRHPRQPVERFVDARLAASRRVLAARPVSVESIIAHLRSHDTCAEAGWSVCMHTDHEVTTASMVAELPVGAPPVIRWTVASPCRSTYQVG
jgi:hypothetical protein